jgi:hypothetical protein
MNNEALKSWLDAMPIDDIRRKIARLESKLADLRVLERIHAERQEPQDATPAAEGEQAAPAQEWGQEPG